MVQAVQISWNDKEPIYLQLRDRLVELRNAARSLGVTLPEPFLQLAFLALPVIPALKITDRGMVDVTRFEIIG